jgi:hypothetical protein
LLQHFSRYIASDAIPLPYAYFKIPNYLRFAMLTQTLPW